MHVVDTVTSVRNSANTKARQRFISRSPFWSLEAKFARSPGPGVSKFGQWWLGVWRAARRSAAGIVVRVQILGPDAHRLGFDHFIDARQSASGSPESADIVGSDADRPQLDQVGDRNTAVARCRHGADIVGADAGAARLDDV